MRQFQVLAQLVRRFADDRGGNFVVLGGLTASMVAMAAGLGINVAQLHNVKSSLSQAVDAAVTSTARDLTTGKIKDEDAERIVLAFIEANADASMAPGAKVTLQKLTVDKVAHTVEATAYVDVDVFFPLFGINNRQRVSATTASLYSDKKIEVAMMLDVTGSMGGQKIKDLKAAAKNAVTILLDGQDIDKPRVRVAMVPYAEAVNTGKLSNSVFVEKPNKSDLPPAKGSPQAASASSGGDGCATERKDGHGGADFSDDGPDSERTADQGKTTYLAMVNRDDRMQNCPKAQVVALTADARKLLATIEDFKADGVTAGGIAAQWGYYMLSPKWSRTIKDAGAGSGPADYNQKKVAKVAILMTDGQFNTAFAGVAKDKTPQMKQGAKSRDYAENLCANMKKDGIEIFTIGFDLDNKDMEKSEKDAAKSVLKNCSSADLSSMKHYYEASTGKELDDAFKAIVNNIERLALTK